MKRYAQRLQPGDPQRVVIDNLKAAVLKRELQDPVLSVPYRKLARHYGFIVSANRPRTPRHKGKVESAVKYVKRNFIAGEEMNSLDLARLNEKGRDWVLQVAGVREGEFGVRSCNPTVKLTLIHHACVIARPDPGGL